MSVSTTLLAFCHLRWNFVYQRPQHLFSRLASRYRVVIVEEPIHDAGAEPHWEVSHPAENVAVYQPHTPVAAYGFCDEQMPHLKKLLADLIEKEGIELPVAWTFTPLAMPLIEASNPQLVVYDCMDELSAFKNAPPQLLQRERELLGRADLVFTGGPSLYLHKKDKHPSVHCFASSVDAKHFGQSKQADLDAPDQRALPHPRLGFYGVIDERFNVPLIAAMAEAHPEWQICLVGPVVKIDPESLPKMPNIHYFGQRSYQELPAYLAGWDVSLMPFARNESTRFISPTKVLEYMVAEKPIVSTPITDVARPYGEIVRLGSTPAEFIAACEAALSSNDADRGRRAEGMRGVLARTSWEATAGKMVKLIDAALGGKRTTSADSTTSKPVVVIGAGPTGLSAAYHLGEDAVLIERENRVGGWCRSIYEKGFTFDFAGHIMFSNDPYVHDLYKKLLGDNVHWQDREAWIYSKNVYTRYPFQGALYGLPADVIKECLVGALEARFGKLKGEAAPTANGKSPANGHVNGNGHLNGNGHANGNGHHNANGHSNGIGHTNGNGHAHLDGHVNSIKLNGLDGNGRLKQIQDCCADGVMESTTKLTHKNVASNGTCANGAAPQTENFEDFIYRVWGAGIAKHFAIPYNRKIWAVPLTEMETSWLGGRVPMPDIEEMIDGALKPVGKPMGPNARFGYPRTGGFQALMDGFLPNLRCDLRLNTGVVSVSPSRHTVTLANGEELQYEQLISTMPLPVLIRSMGDEVPEEVQAAAKGLRHTSVRCVHIGVARENLTEKHWIYYPEDTVFHRIFVQGNASPYCNAPGGFGLTCEITYGPHKPLPCEGEALIQRCIEDCHKVGIFTPQDEVIVGLECDMPHAYVVYDHARPRNVKLIRDWLARHDITLAGRYSEWEYYNSDHAFIAGKRAADSVAAKMKRQVAVGA